MYYMHADLDGIWTASRLAMEPRSLTPTMETIDAPDRVLHVVSPSSSQPYPSGDKPFHTRKPLRHHKIIAMCESGAKNGFFEVEVMARMEKCLSEVAIKPMPFYRKSIPLLTEAEWEEKQSAVPVIQLDNFEMQLHVDLDKILQYGFTGEKAMDVKEAINALAQYMVARAPDRFKVEDFSIGANEQALRYRIDLLAINHRPKGVLLIQAKKAFGAYMATRFPGRFTEEDFASSSVVTFNVTAPSSSTDDMELKFPPGASLTRAVERVHCELLKEKERIKKAREELDYDEEALRYRFLQL